MLVENYSNSHRVLAVLVHVIFSPSGFYCALVLSELWPDSHEGATRSVHVAAAATSGQNAAEGEWSQQRDSIVFAL